MNMILTILALFSFSLASNSVPNIKKVATSSSISTTSLLDGESFGTEGAFVDSFETGVDQNRWHIVKNVWGQVSGRVNGGVIPENVTYDGSNQTVGLLARGSYYAKEEVKGLGGVTDGSLTGAVLMTKVGLGPGRYVTRLKPAPRIGVCSAFWTYSEDESANNHEIDIELPFSNGTKNDFNEIGFTNYVGAQSQVRTRLTNTLNDGNFHEFAFDWYYSNTHKQVDYYVDGQKLGSITKNIPYLTGPLNIGVWIPNNPNFVGSPDFESAIMNVDSVSYTPFANQIHTVINNTANPNKVASSSQYPSSTPEVEINEYSNGDFEFSSIKNYPYLNNYGFSALGSPEIIKDASSNGTKVASLPISSSFSQVIDSVEPLSSRSLTFSLLGQGKVTLEAIDDNGTSLSLKEQEVSSSTWALRQISYTFPINATSLKITFSSTSAPLFVDNIIVNRTQNPLPSEENESLFFTPYGNSNASNQIGTSFKRNISFSPEANKSWLLSNGKYYSNSVLLGCEETTTSTTPEASIGNILDTSTSSQDTMLRAIYQATNKINTSYTQALAMDYDISSFSDLTFFIGGYAIDPSASYYHNLVLYSLDSGANYVVLKDQFIKNSNGMNTNALDKYSIRVDSSSISVPYSKIRFALATIAYSVGGQGTKVSGIILNEKQSISSFLETSILCSTSLGNQLLLQAAVNNGGSTLDSFLNETIVNDGSLSYKERYDYLLSSWAKNTSTQQSSSLFKEIETLPVIGIVSISLLLTIISFVFFRKRKRN